MRITIRLVLIGVLASTRASAQETPSPRCSSCTRARTRWPSSTRRAVKSWAMPRRDRTPRAGRLRRRKARVREQLRGPGPQGGHTLSVIDIAARKELHRVDLSPLSRPHGLWFADGKLYFTAEANMAIGRYDPATNKVDWVLGTGQERTHMIVVAKDQKTIFTSNVSSNTISIIEPGGSRQGPFGPGGPPPGGPPPGGPGGPPREGPGGPPPGGPGGPPPMGSREAREVRAGLAGDRVALPEAPVGNKR